MLVIQPIMSDMLRGTRKNSAGARNSSMETALFAAARLTTHKVGFLLSLTKSVTSTRCISEVSR